MNTNTIAAGMRSPSGASAALLLAARRRKTVLLANLALALEYEAICQRSEHVMASGLTQKQVNTFLDVVVGLIEPVETHFVWRPMLRDPGDELVLKAAVNGRANAIVTFNGKGFGSAPSQFGVGVLTPAAAFRKIE